MSIEAMKQALEALDEITDDVDGTGLNTTMSFDKSLEAITSLRQAIEQAEKQEPTEDMVLALRGASGLGTEDAIDALRDVLAVMPLYTTPQPQEFVCSTGLCHYKTAAQREWVGLTDNEMLMIYGQQHEGEKYSLGRMVERALKEKNT